MGEKSINVVDLFAGAGGLSRGFQHTKKVKVVAAFENNKWAKQTYEKNHSDVKMFGDITKELKDLKQYLDMNKEKVHIVCGGPPCQGFSNANRQKASLGSSNNELVKAYVSAIEMMNPDAFVMENVKMLQSPTHKFFLSKEENVSIAELEIKLKNEKVILSKRTRIIDSLTTFLKENKLEIQNDVDFLQKYIVNNEKIISKLAHLIRKEKQFEDFVNKNKSILTDIVSKWDRSHEAYWSEEYLQLGVDLKLTLERYFIGDMSEQDSIIRIIKDILDSQKLLSRMNEIVKKQFYFEWCDPSETEIYVSLTTYSVLDYLKASFKKLGYVFNDEKTGLILNAADFGAPQVRERLFIIGVKKDVFELSGQNDIMLPDAIISKDDRYSVRDAIEDLENLHPEVQMTSQPQSRLVIQASNPLASYLFGNKSSLIYNHIMTETREIAKQRFEKITEGKNFHHLDDSLKTTYSNPNRTQNTVYLRLKYDETSGTVVNVRKSMWIHPKQHRAISIREAARLQTFQDDFVFKGPKDAQYQQVGNAVPPLLGWAVAEHVLRLLGVEPLETLENIVSKRALNPV